MNNDVHSISFRSAMPDEIKKLNHLMKLSKNHWGYTKDYLDKFVELFQLDETYLKNNIVKVFSIEKNIIGFIGLKCRPDQAMDLDYFFIHPNYINQGWDKQLWLLICKIAKNLGCKEIYLESDPHAEFFYKKMGCERIGIKISILLPNREVPLMKYQCAMTEGAFPIKDFL